MRKLVLRISVTLDGFVAGPKGGQDWVFKYNDEAFGDWLSSKLEHAGMHLMGSNVFQDMMAYWPFSDNKFAWGMNAVPKGVYSRHRVNKEPDLRRGVAGFRSEGIHQTIKSMKEKPGSTEKLVSWKDALVLQGDLAEEINKLKMQPGRYLLAHGGAGFAQQLAALNLVDEYMLITYPVAIGQGMPLFGALTKPLELVPVNTHLFESGIIVRSYHPKKK